MKKLKLRERLVDPNSPDRRPRRAAYALPTFFTAGNLFLGFFSIVQAFQGAMLAVTGNLGFNHHLQAAAITIGVAVFLDGLDGRIARLTNTVSQFGGELDSLADVIAFGVAPAVLAWVWGFQFVDGGINAQVKEQIHRAGFFFVFLYLMCGAARLARFNIQVNESGTEKPRTSGPEILRWASDTCRRGAVGCNRVRLTEHSSAMVAILRRMARAARTAFVPDDQHVALSQL
jgi:CDP-diacylglycerol--serine O-phosphatidyltransferase